MAKLFEKWNIGSLELENRIVIAPMCQYSARDGQASSWHMMHLGSLSHSGAGLLILEATAVTANGRISWADLGLYDDYCEAALENVVTEVRRYSSMPLAIQLAHAGRKASTEKPWNGGGQIAPTSEHGWQTVAPSAVAFHEGEHPPKELGSAEMNDIKKAFVESAQRASRIGFQGIEIHAAHGYLLHQFLSPLSNRRQDQYGGSLENRMRFPLEVFAAVREAVDADVAVWVRISATDWVEGGWNLEEAIEFSRRLKELGCPAIHVSSGGLDPRQNITLGAGYQVEFAEKIKHGAQVETIAVGLITDPEHAEEILQNEKADAIAIARAVLYDPRWPWHAAAKLNASVKCPPQYLRSQPRGLAKLLQSDRTE
ncbi:NADH:flavin oxidoreductase/NADH oxidase [Bdellovibrio bacteriovorus]|uniref:NADH:flavin oxidoreductase/NADH oxidase n=1 Tax=Bdellovibrio bacteriovorus TaxID=959 RepID=UPI0021D1DA1C|nr:NADH:flavin oxidoreductase/NADH oxidase [Bdellovibrio bacteriovorus]UXR65935.1 NADH:flavin oxidoreductase/NADH oxidase [Bdellovibrio bacteriovorus]